ncbi:CBS domain-containing protein [Ornithinimicrobium sp. Y1847]|uniref:CBS domain-containing protein n=1 Tax=unclassified Ornithinimicrobium TaxID=2615080 RepID=UPI003B6818A2
MRVAELLKKKGSTVVTLPATASVSTLLETLDDHKIGAVVVVDDSTTEEGGTGTVVGIVSERDVVHHLRGGTDTEVELSALMTSEVRTCSLEDEVQDLAVTMTEHRHRHVPVVQDGTLHGIISIGDVVKARLDALEAERDHLESYLRQ